MRRVVLAILVVCSAPALALGIDIPGDPSSCGFIIVRGDPGNLLDDLDCTGQNMNAALRLTRGAIVNLNGHRITNPWSHGIACEPAVSPSGTCSINGPGEITGSVNGIAAASRVRVRDVTIHGNDTGIWKIYGDITQAARLDLTNVIIRDNARQGVRGGGAIRATDTVIRDNGDVGLTSYGPSRLVRTTITGNGSAGIVTGVYHDFYEVYFYSERALVSVDSDVSDNGVVDGESDLVAARLPKLRRSTCGTSEDPTAPGTPTWGVCSND